MGDGKNILKDKSFAFAVDVVKLCRYLTEFKKEFILSRQLLKSGTAIGALIREAQNAESKADFIHKLAIAQKECDETIYWLELLNQTDYLNEADYRLNHDCAESLLKMIRSAILTTRQNLKITHNP